MEQRRNWTHTANYIGLLAGAFAVAVVMSWIFGSPLNNAAYDFMFRSYRPQPWPIHSVVLAIDEDTLKATPDGMYGIRRPLADALRLIATVGPKAVAIDLILADKRKDGA